MYRIDEREVKRVAEVIASAQLFRYAEGKVARWTALLEQQLAEKVGTRHALAVSSGTGALICALAGIGAGPGDEIIVPGYTFIATALAPPAVGAVPISAEIDETLTIDPADVEAKITPQTKAIVPVHMAGLPCDMEALCSIAAKHDVRIIEDAAQAAGGAYQGRRFGSIGDVGILSFNHYKIITAGEGGAVVTDDETIHKRAMVYHDGGCVFFDKDAAAENPPFYCGNNYRISEISSAILTEQVRRLDGILKKLRRNKIAMAEVLWAGADFQPSPCNDVDGDCSSTLPLLFESAQGAKAFLDRNRDVVDMYRPIETDRHVYSNWEPVLRKRTHHARFDPWQWAARSIEYSPEMCPQTLDILSRTVSIQTPYEATGAQAAAIARKLLN